ncbi:hypothetical protein HGRIS_013387 [Hohenbuehelia grisea]|uniref:DUF6593 domain-containing protein n=1 Tax=Hohenbuehelia grisea TaxID=104357 RepID=A0ABR3IVK0_9AGAR
MKLYMSKTSAKNATYALENGQVIYRVDTPLKLGNRVTTIERIAPNHTPNDMHDAFNELAKIEWQVIKSSRINMHGTSKSVSEIFRRGGYGAYGRHRIFAGPDGREYRWKLGNWSSKLCLNDGSKAVVAKYHRPALGFNTGHSRAYLEIFPLGEGIADYILVTFVYIEKLRKDRERASRSGGS